MTDQSVTFFFCDDVRQEIGGKLTFVGLYRDYVAYGKGAVRLPQIVAAVLITVGPGFKGALGSFSVMYRNEQIAEAKFTIPTTYPSIKEARAAGVSERISFPVVLPLHGFPVFDKAVLTAHLKLGDYEVASDDLLFLEVESIPNGPHPVQ